MKIDEFEINQLMGEKIPMFNATKKLAASTIAIAISGCVMAPMKPTSEIVVHQPSKETAALLETQANKCWALSWGYSHDGIKVDARRMINNTYRISAARFAGDIGLREPFFELEVADGGDGTSRVSTHEGDYACSLAGYCYSVQYTDDVKKWLNGDLSCTKKNEPVI